MRRIGQVAAVSTRATFMLLSRRSFLAPRPRPLSPRRRLGGAGLGRCRCRHRRGGCGRHCGRARKIAPTGKPSSGRGFRPHWRPLHHRDAHFRRAVRSRRAFDSHAGFNPLAKLARAPDLMSIRRRRARSFGSAAATGAKGRWRIFLRRWCARTAPSTRPPAARPSRGSCGIAEGPRRLAENVEFMLGPFASARILPKSPPPISRARPTATSMRLPARPRRDAGEAGRGFPMQLSTPVRAHQQFGSQPRRSGNGAREVDGRAVDRHRFHQRISGEKIRFAPDLPSRHSMRRRSFRSAATTISCWS